MKILAISLNGFQKLVREKVIFSFAFIAVLLILLSLVLGSMSFDEQIRILIHFGSAALLFSLMGIALVYGSSVIQKEIESQTILLTLARPLSRSEYFIGQWLALVWVIALNWIILTIIIYALTGFTLPLWSYFQAQFILFIEIILLLTAAMFFANFIRPIISFFAGLCLYLFGQWMPDMIFFAEKSKSTFFLFFANSAHQFFPQLYRMSIQSHSQITSGKFNESIFQVTLHGVGWILFFLVLAVFAFRRKDLV